MVVTVSGLKPTGSRLDLMRAIAANGPTLVSDLAATVRMARSDAVALIWELISEDWLDYHADARVRLGNAGREWLARHDKEN